MTGEIGHATGWMPNGFDAWVALWIWLGLVLLHGLFWRSTQRPGTDPIRASGPIAGGDVTR